ncbi:hypothetical protein [[Mycoplasma] anseris]|uniref:Uncharacterized protein n=1 Tax=[Mycoplasma] anseris TaxID=92400 RepID=A0A2Z4NCR9_9BACT|nr:hypothetical protein [[Mycoplasma] anseris]AWX69352.1 hypothetical protein DP065_01100 [[Mycoplasma] anseris]
MNKKTKTKLKLLNFIAFLVVFSFLIAGVILILAGAKIFGEVNQGTSITLYVFGSISLAIFLLIIIKIILITKKENTYEKNAFDVDNYLSNTEKSEELKTQEQEILLLMEPMDLKSRDIFYAFMLDFERKTFKKPDLQIKSHELNIAILNLIKKVKEAYEYFDVYLAIDFVKSLNKKFLLKGEYKKYQIYFDNIREIIHLTDDFVQQQHKDLELSQGKIKL